jgi:hypothetical protein
MEFGDSSGPKLPNPVLGYFDEDYQSTQVFPFIFFPFACLPARSIPAFHSHPRALPSSLPKKKNTMKHSSIVVLSLALKKEIQISGDKITHLFRFFHIHAASFHHNLTLFLSVILFIQNS